MNELSRYIEQQRKGGSVESVGSFTVAIEKARDKLGAHSLAKPEDYILKLVQCAVALGVQTLHIKLLQRSVLVYFETPAAERALSLEPLTKALAAPLEESHKARSYLALAICAVAAQQPDELMWGEWDGQGTAAILSLGRDRSELFRDAPFPRIEPLHPSQRFFLFYLKKPATALPIGQTGREHSALSQRCSFAPLRILLDGRPISPSLPTYFPTGDPVSEYTSPYLGALEISAQQDRPLRWSGVSEEKRGWQSPLPPELTLLSASLPPVFSIALPEGFEVPVTSEVTFTAVYGLPIFLYGASHLHYVKDGVTLHPVKVHDAGGGAFAVLGGDHIKTDLTGLQVVVDTTVQQDTDQVTEIWKKLALRVTKPTVPLYSNRTSMTRQSTVFAAVGCCLLGPLGLIAGPVYSFFSARSRKTEQTRRKLFRQLEVRRGYIAYFRNEVKDR